MYRRVMPPVLAVFIAAPVAATPPDASTIMQHMNAALSPAQPSLQKLTIFVRHDHEQAAPVVAYQARKRLPNGNWLLTILQSPNSTAGIASLVQEREGKPPLQWVYLPAVRRVREIKPLGAHQPFLGTDFTYTDLGFLPAAARTYTLLGMEKHDGVWAYRIQETPRQSWYYARIVTWVAADSWLPLQRNYYGMDQRLLKQERFEEIKRIDGQPTSLWMTMDGVPTGGSSKIEVTAVDQSAVIADSLFDPAHLADAAASPIWYMNNL